MDSDLRHQNLRKSLESIELQLAPGTYQFGCQERPTSLEPKRPWFSSKTCATFKASVVQRCLQPKKWRVFTWNTFNLTYVSIKMVMWHDVTMCLSVIFLPLFLPKSPPSSQRSSAMACWTNLDSINNLPWIHGPWNSWTHELVNSGPRAARNSSKDPIAPGFCRFCKVTNGVFFNK